MPFGAVVLHLEPTAGGIYVYALVDPVQPKEDRWFCAVKTGDEIQTALTAQSLVGANSHGVGHVGTCDMISGPIHVFQVSRKPDGISG